MKTTTNIWLQAGVLKYCVNWHPELDWNVSLNQTMHRLKAKTRPAALKEGKAWVVERLEESLAALNAGKGAV